MSSWAAARMISLLSSLPMTTISSPTRQISARQRVEIVGDDLAGDRRADDQAIDLVLDFGCFLLERAALGGFGLRLGDFVVLAEHSFLRAATVRFWCGDRPTRRCSSSFFSTARTWPALTVSPSRTLTSSTKPGTAGADDGRRRIIDDAAGADRAGPREQETRGARCSRDPPRHERRAAALETVGCLSRNLHDASHRIQEHRGDRPGARRRSPRNVAELGSHRVEHQQQAGIDHGPPDERRNGVDGDDAAGARRAVVGRRVDAEHPLEQAGDVFLPAAAEVRQFEPVGEDVIAVEPHERIAVDRNEPRPAVAATLSIAWRTTGLRRTNSRG